MSLENNLREMERARERYWRHYLGTSPIKLRWRALTVRHCFHILPGESILEIGAGTRLWTEHLSEVLRQENEITAAVFNPEFAADPRWQRLRNVHLVESLEDLPAESFNYIAGTAILCHSEYQCNLRSLYRLLKPGGELALKRTVTSDRYVTPTRQIGPGELPEPPPGHRLERG